MSLLRFAPIVSFGVSKAKSKLKEIAAIAGIGTIYGLLFVPAEAQLPDFEILGIDTTWVHEYLGGQWHETHTEVNRVSYPGSSTKG